MIVFATVDKILANKIMNINPFTEIPSLFGVKNCVLYHMNMLVFKQDLQNRKITKEDKR